jgi:proteasome accessory factor B
MSKLERLLNLTAALINTNRPLSAEEIRSAVEGYAGTDASFRRGFERDKEELRAMGVPITLATVPGTDPPTIGYRIDRKEYSGAVPELTADELATLHLAANLVRLQGLSAAGAFWKMGGEPGASASDDPMVALPGAEQLAPLFRAASERRLARFVYNGSDREIEPHLLTLHRGHWYVSGFDRTKRDERVFRVDRVAGAVQVGERVPFEGPIDVRPDLAMRGWELGDGDPVEARLLVDADQAPLATHHIGAENIDERQPNGSIVFRMTVRNPDAFRSFVLSFLEHAEVLEPAELRAVIVEWLMALA